MYLGTPGHDQAAAERLNPDPRLLWKTDVGRAVRGAPALGETIIAVGATERLVLLLDRDSGEPLWRLRVNGPIHSGPLLDGDRLYVATERPGGSVTAVRLRDGRRLWSQRVGSVAAPLAFDGEGLYAGTETGRVLRLDPENGRPVWRADLGGAIRAAPVVTPREVLAATTRDTVYLLDRATGAVRARLATAGSVLATPALGPGRLFLATSRGRVAAVSLPELSVVWDFDAGDAVFGAPALVGDTLYVLARDGRLSVIPVATPRAARVLALDITAVAGADAHRLRRAGGERGRRSLARRSAHRRRALARAAGWPGGAAAAGAGSSTGGDRRPRRYSRLSMTRLPLILLALAAPPLLGAQDGLVHYGKWLTAATAVAFTWMGAHEHTRSSRAWDELMSLCRADNANCTLGLDGTYVDATAERHYQTVRHYDRRARVRLLSGQGALLVTVGLFVLDFGRGKDGPGNIPFAPLEIAVDHRTGSARASITLAF